VQKGTGMKKDNKKETAKSKREAKENLPTQDEHEAAMRFRAVSNTR
jgi:hypothetical protein